ncbi:hypothetical protein AB832_07165 [Flavobacteriaceae bacterium (ex Bugula neritina AB1)]|nr:hypothetical protein AB832_07165 [Flavobacteriaceae bacterium (ex Bugula neritina AB1)]
MVKKYRNLEELRLGLAGHFKELSDQTKRALGHVGDAVRVVAQGKTPVDTGQLKGSIISMTYSDHVEVKTNIHYALKVHEDLTARHKVGEAKFLEKAVNEIRPIAGRIVADYVNSTTKKK